MPVNNNVPDGGTTSMANDERKYRLGDSFSIRVVEDINEFMSLHETWDTLLSNHVSHVPFLCHDWFRIWLKHFLKEDRLFILLLYNDNRLVAIAPFMTNDKKFKGIIRAKKIELIGNHHSFVRKFIFDNTAAEEKKKFTRLIFYFLMTVFKDWDVLELDSIPEEDDLFIILNEVIAETGVKSRQHFCFGDWYLDGIDYSAETYMKSLSPNTRKGVGKKKRRMERIGDVDFQVGKDKEKLDHYLSLYQEVRGKSWKSREKDVAFLRDSREFLAEKGWLVFAFVVFDRCPIAVKIAVISNHIAYLVETLYNLKYERYSPGEISHAEFIRYLIGEERVTEIDTLKGDETYKQSWTPKRRERKGFLIFNDTMKGNYLAFLMTRVLPLFENNQYLLAFKNKLVRYLKK